MAGPTEIATPFLGVNDADARVARWHVEDGARVTAGQLLCTLETTKAAIEVEAPGAGVLQRVAAEGTPTGVGATLARLFADDAELAAARAAAAAAPAPDAARPDRPATAKAIRAAERLGVALASIPGDGPIKESDVLAFAGASDAGADAGADGGTAAGGAERGRPSSVVTLDRPRVVIIGAGGHGAECLEMLRAQGAFEVVGFLDRASAGTEYAGLPVLGDDDRLEEMAAQGVRNAVVAAGWLRGAELRRRIFRRAAERGFTFPTLIHRTATVYPSARVGAGSQIFAQAVVGASAVLGEAVVVNNGAVVSHDCVIGAYTHVTPGATLAGNVKVGSGCLIGMNATVYVGVRIADGAVVNNNAAVVADIA